MKSDLNTTPLLSLHDQRQQRLRIALHWLTLLLIVAVYASMELRGFFAKGSDGREAMKTGHFVLGLAVLAVSIVRVMLRWLGSDLPPIHPPLQTWQRRASGAMHLALYVLLLAMPALGWLILSASGKPIVFFGLPWPSLIGEHKYLARLLTELHETLGTLGYVLIGTHALAAVWHHHVVRDNTLLRMLPSRR